MPSAPLVLARTDDETRRLAHVRPAGWRNPVPPARYDLLVIGAGTAGLVTAAIAAGLGARVALVERHWMGGDCLNVGCVPSKLLLHGARHADGSDDAFARTMARLRRVRADIAHVDGAERFAGLGVDVHFGEARFVARDAVSVDGVTLRFHKAVVATGARAALPPIPGLAESAPRTNETIFDLDARPARLVVIGGGPIGCELAQAFARHGTRVTLLNADPRLLARDEGDAGALVEAALVRAGVTVRNGVRIERVVRDADGVRLAYVHAGATHSATGDELLVAAGRAPNVEGLELARAGIAHDRTGIRTDARLRTTNARVFAIGDVLGGAQFTHVADAHARLVVANALFRGIGGGRADRLVIPRVTYTTPEVASVGLTTDAAAAAGTAIDTVRVDFAHVDRAIIDDATEGFLVVHLRPGSDRILGATIAGAHAGELLAPLTHAMTHGLGLGALGRTIHPYPTLGEVIRKAADQHRRRGLTPGRAALLKRALRWLR